MRHDGAPPRPFRSASNIGSRGGGSKKWIAGCDVGFCTGIRDRRRALEVYLVQKGDGRRLAGA